MRCVALLCSEISWSFVEPAIMTYKPWLVFTFFFGGGAVSLATSLTCSASDLSEKFDLTCGTGSAEFACLFGRPTDAGMGEVSRGDVGLGRDRLASAASS